ncbi:MAG TPA: homoserine kinase [Marinilabiliales bacterium]|jgi:homoserine kinase|nr:MAG: homoserine kinase [Bacteroidetes bacterium GWA2_40_14]OFX60464.1 MAG: homoserine kinase [Bacteroidetes bacterium GWC2_40_13]OFX75479.1 MAG: homoserine kinase [Bacteroidetes bacterium GWD2_40_43]OFX93994.1 MAG: homoserine kinase [Bacteroidetes bacterium GWE2_40_63]OFZ28194.1 MAG: homoserine kinase [Bacteroidetes bacterium RIFOXYC2_FULL_40_12]HAN00076.1 homoserine kinase [Marinilabiliales bacterium]
MNNELKKKVKAFAPASVANVSCGFDVLGFAIDKVGDTLQAEATSYPGVIIESVTGPGNLSTDPDKNICGVIAKAMLAKLDLHQGVRIRLTKGILPGSGLGSSAASSAVTAFAMNELFGNPFTEKQLVEFAMLGEKLASGSAHADNVAPAIMGGFTAVRSYEPLDIFKIPVPNELYCTVIHPKIEVRTELSRNILKKQVELKTAIKQWGNVAGLVAGLYSSNYDLIGRSLTDYIIEPVRSRLIPGYFELTQNALLAGALGCGISGSGPSVFSLCKGHETAKKVADAFTEKAVLLGLPFDIYVSKIAEKGARIIDNE